MTLIPSLSRLTQTGQRVGVYILLCAVLLAAAAPIQAAQDSELFRSIYEKEWAFRLKEFPTFASYVGTDDYADMMGRESEADQARRAEYWKGIRAELDSVSCERLDRNECINYRIFRSQMDNYISGFENKSYMIPFNSDWGFYMSWARMPGDTDFDSVTDYRNYLSRLHQLPRLMDEYIALMRKGIEIGMTQPRVILDGRDEPIKAQLVKNVEESPFFQPFKDMPESMVSGEKAELLATAQEVVATDVIPAYQRLYDFFQEEYIPGARTSLGASGITQWRGVLSITNQAVRYG